MAKTARIQTLTNMPSKDIVCMLWACTCACPVFQSGSQRLTQAFSSIFLHVTFERGSLINPHLTILLVAGKLLVSICATDQCWGYSESYHIYSTWILGILMLMQQAFYLLMQTLQTMKCCFTEFWEENVTFNIKRSIILKWTMQKFPWIKKHWLIKILLLERC